MKHALAEVGKNIKSAMGLPKKLPELPAREVMTWGWAWPDRHYITCTNTQLYLELQLLNYPS
jgi:hypothetical protein